ncbi:MAG: aldehyde dehydrogenase family protein [Candidatus Hydrogenedentes bacterium]|nr:aldehyde dehydrogenase family protein [Candidatus Hydrogenedentota bacterium]
MGHAAQEIVVRDPRTGQVLYSFQEPSDDDIRHTFDEARAAFNTIRAMTVRERLNETLKLKHYFLANKEKIVDRVVQETGKARTDALISEVFTVLDIIDYYDKHAERHLADEKVPTPIILQGKKSKIFYSPLGTVLIISPWNYPLNLAMVPMITAFVAGNSVVFKPSEWTPLKGLVEEIVEGSGFMKEAVHVVYGGKDTGRRLIDRRPAKILFTGSTRAGKQIMEQAAKHLIPVELELGGKDPMVVFEDADLDRTAVGAVWGAMTNCGQTCTSVERVLVQERIYTQFVDVLKQKIEKLSHPAIDPKQPDAGDLDVGFMTAPFQIEKVEDQVNEAVARGAKIHTGGSRDAAFSAYPPTLITDVDSSMKICTDETFGPVLTVQPFKTEEEAITMANDSPYGLSASVWSRDIDRATRVARAIDTGNVSINNVLATQGNSALPFGGTKESGFGRYKGPHGLHSFSNIKSIMIDTGGKFEPHWYPYSREKYVLFSKLLDAVYGGGPFWLLKTLLVGMKLEGVVKKNRL